ncbi:MAG: hypothetical protein E6J12_11305 [Chloroflexi bacterium]|nr:MAG: hypothetical protein E6J12_11305 [Chloroflexota bacterium]
MRLMRLLVSLAIAVSSVLAGAVIGSAATSAAYTCSGGTARHPSIINPGNYSAIIVTGKCLIPGGTVNVRHDVTIGPGAALIANLGGSPGGPPEDDAILNVGGSMLVGGGATLIMGCAPSFGCNTTTPDKIAGDLIADHPLGLLLHADSVGGDFTIHGGGGQDYSCSGKGIFTQFQSPVYSTFEDGSIGRNATIDGYKSCWLGFTRTYVGGDLSVNNNILGDPDAIEILSSHIVGNLSCHGNMFADTSTTPATFTLHQPWDSADTSSTGSLYPRTWEPNTVINGKRYGQCVHAPAITRGGTSPGPF